LKTKVDKLLTLAKNYNATLIGVSKRIDIKKVIESTNYGIVHLGESRVQELNERYKIFKDLNTTTHFIGHLQGNKSKKCVELADYIHTIDSLKKAKIVDRYSNNSNKKQKIFIQVNISNDDKKFGFTKKAFLENFQEIYNLKNLNIIGLMTIGIKTTDNLIIKNYYKQLRILKEEVSKSFDVNKNFKHLSMGMSGDYQIALDEGATFIRVGSGIYGERLY